jgi:hypothetical protein
MGDGAMKASDAKKGMVVYDKSQDGFVKVHYTAGPTGYVRVTLVRAQFGGELTHSHLSSLRPLTKRERGEGGAK